MNIMVIRTKPYVLDAIGFVLTGGVGVLIFFFYDKGIGTFIEFLFASAFLAAAAYQMRKLLSTRRYEITISDQEIKWSNLGGHEYKIEVNSITHITLLETFKGLVLQIKGTKSTIEIPSCSFGTKSECDALLKELQKMSSVYGFSFSIKLSKNELKTLAPKFAKQNNWSSE